MHCYLFQIFADDQLSIFQAVQINTAVSWFIIILFRFLKKTGLRGRLYFVFGFQKLLLIRKIVFNLKILTNYKLIPAANYNCSNYISCNGITTINKK